MSAQRPRICLNMIVKDETPVLDRLFQSVRNYIDYWVIVDTGSSDGTQRFIVDWWQRAGVPGELYERRWENFGVNRQQALELALAADQADWLLFIDADEELIVTDADAFGKLEPGKSYGMEKNYGDWRYQLPLLINVRDSKWRWEAPVHEYIQQLAGPAEIHPLRGVSILCRPGEGARSVRATAEQKYLADARLLEAYLAENPGDPRSHFYLAQSYKNAGHLDKAYDAFRQRAALPGWEEENYMAQLETGRVAIQLGKPEEVILEDLLAAFEMRPSRAEPLHELARYYRLRKKFARALIFAQAGAGFTRPADRLFVAAAIYDWQLLDELGVSAYWAGAWSTSAAACRQILQKVEQGLVVPEPDLERIRTNLQFAVDKLDELAQGQSSRLP